MSDSQKTQIIGFCKTKERITSTDARKILGGNTSQALAFLKKMANEGILKQNKSGNRYFFTLVKTSGRTTIPTVSPTVVPTSSLSPPQSMLNQATASLEAKIAALSQKLDVLESFLKTLGFQPRNVLDPDQFRKALLEEYRWLNPEISISGVELATIRRRVARKLMITEELFSDYLFDLRRKNSHFTVTRGREKEFFAISPAAFN